jgi:hypothetical protein
VRFRRVMQGAKTPTRRINVLRLVPSQIGFGVARQHSVSVHFPLRPRSVSSRQGGWYGTRLPFGNAFVVESPKRRDLMKKTKFFVDQAVAVLREATAGGCMEADQSRFGTQKPGNRVR